MYILLGLFCIYVYVIYKCTRIVYTYKIFLLGLLQIWKH
jgi:hypothetical protein